MNIATIFIEKITFGHPVTEASQIAIIFNENGEMRCLHYFIENPAKHSMNASALKTALIVNYTVLGD